ncbi:MAG: hypothetical protein JXQ87_08925 [Bacteroidia bacterium]
MRYFYLTIILFLASGLSSCLLNPICPGGNMREFYLSERVKSWLPDSMLSKSIKYRSSNGFSESIYRRSFLENEMNWQSNGRGCDTETEYSSCTFESSYTTTEIYIRISSYENEERFSIDFNDFAARFDFSTGSSGSITKANLFDDTSVRLASEWEFLSSIEFNGNVYSDVAKITQVVVEGEVDEHTPEIVFYGKGFGILAFKQFDGVVWELDN